MGIGIADVGEVALGVGAVGEDARVEHQGAEALEVGGEGGLQVLWEVGWGLVSFAAVLPWRDIAWRT